MMSDAQTGQVVATAAQVYDEFFVPALFGEWAPRVCDAALVGEGQRVLDVGCGTGVAAREAAARVGPSGSVTGVDVNDGMLAVARQRDARIDWRLGRAEALPCRDDEFDAAISQFALMFMEDPDAALVEMARVTRPGGQIAVAVWCALAETPGYTAMFGLLRRLFGDTAAESLRVPYAMGDAERLAARFAAAGLSAEVTVGRGTARFPSIEAWVHTDVRGWTLADAIDDDQYALLLNAARDELRRFESDDGTVRFDHPALIATATAN